MCTMGSSLICLWVKQNEIQWNMRYSWLTQWWEINEHSSLHYTFRQPTADSLCPIGFVQTLKRINRYRKGGHTVHAFETEDNRWQKNLIFRSSSTKNKSKRLSKSPKFGGLQASLSNPNQVITTISLVYSSKILDQLKEQHRTHKSFDSAWFLQVYTRVI